MYDRKLKNLARQKILEYMAIDDVIVGDSIWFPASQALCVLQAQQMGLLTQNTILVEKDASIIDDFDQITEHLPNRIIHHGELSALKLINDVSYAFFDLNGCMDEKIARWVVENFIPYVKFGGIYSFNYLYGNRSNIFQPKILSALKKLTIYKQLKKYMNEEDDLIMGPLALLHCLFDDLDVYHNEPIYYCDTVPMCTYTLEIVSDKKSIRAWPTIDELIDMMDNPSPIRPVKSHRPVKPATITSHIPRRKNMTATQQIDALVKSGKITKKSAGAYKANITRKHRVIDNDKSLSSGSAAAKKAHISRKILSSAKGI